MPVLSYFLGSYYQLLNFEEMNSEILYEEFIDIKTIQLANVKFLDEVVVCNYQDRSKEHRTDTIWYHLQLLKFPVGNNSRFKTLFKVTRIVLLAPHFNA